MWQGCVGARFMPTLCTEIIVARAGFCINKSVVEIIIAAPCVSGKHVSHKNAGIGEEFNHTRLIFIKTAHFGIPACKYRTELVLFETVRQNVLSILELITGVIARQVIARQVKCRVQGSADPLGR